MGIIDRKLLWLALSGTGAANLSGADALLDGEAQGLAFDFTDQSVRIIDTSTPSNSTRSTGVVNQGSLVGPSGKLVYTSAANKLTLQSDGVMRYQAHNLCPYSDDFSTGWTTTAASVSGQQITFDNTVAFHRIRYADIIAAGVPAQYRMSCVIERGSADYAVLVFYYAASGTIWVNAVIDFDAVTIATGQGTGTAAVGGDKGSATVTSLGGNRFEVSWIFRAATTAGANAIGFSVTDDGTATGDFGMKSYAAGNVTYTVEFTHIHRYPANTDYIRTSASAVYALPLEYSATDGSCLGLPVEEQRTNLCLHSTDFSDSTAHNTNEILPFGSGSTVNAGVSPDGRTNADFVVPSTASASHWTSLAVASVTSGSTYTASVYVKAGGYNFVQITPSTGFPTTAYANFNIATGALGNSNAVTGTIKDCGSGWYRISIAVAANASSAGRFILAVLNADTASRLPSYAGDGVSGVYFYQGQLEQGSFPTSPVITYGAAATRAVDNISIATSAFPVNLSAGTLLASWKSLSTSVSANNGIGLHGTSASADRVQMRAGTFYCTGSSTTQTVSPSGGGVSTSVVNRIIAYASNDLAGCVNGGTVATQGTNTVPTSLTTLDLNIDRSTSLNPNGVVSKIVYVPRRKTDAELQAETT